MSEERVEHTESRDAAHWAAPVSKLEVSDVPSGAVSLNVEGRHVVGPLQGFGQLWQKTYRVRLTDAGVTPDDVVSHLKKSLPEYMPDNSRFYPSVAGVEPGEVVLINAMSIKGHLVPSGLKDYIVLRSAKTWMPQGFLAARIHSITADGKKRELNPK